jgi:uncharacterized protein YycO
MRFVLKKGTTTLDDAIKWFTRGAYSHASLLTPDDRIIEAVWPKVREQAFLESYPEKCKYNEFEVKTTPYQDALITEFARKQVGKPYDLIGDLRFVTRQNYQSQPDNKWFCSELVFQSFLAGGVTLFNKTEGWEVCPDLLKRSPLAKML